MAVAFVVAVIAAGQVQSRVMAYFLVALTVVWLVGFIDDLREVPPSVKLLAHATSAVLLYYGGVGVAISTSTVVNLIATIILVIWFVNAFNFIDGADGVAAGIAGLVAFAFMALFAIQHNSGSLVVAVALFGCCLGFLLFNFPPASIFMGDCGSTMLGLVLAWLSLVSIRTQPGTYLSLATPLMFSSLPLADATFAVIRRVRGRKSPFAGDRRHFYDLLLQRGWSCRRVALVSYLATAVFAFLGLLGQGAHLNVELAAVASVLMVVLGITLGSLIPEAQITKFNETNTAHSGMREQISKPDRKVAPTTDSAI